MEKQRGRGWKWGYQRLKVGIARSEVVVYIRVINERAERGQPLVYISQRQHFFFLPFHGTADWDAHRVKGGACSVQGPAPLLTSADPARAVRRGRGVGLRNRLPRLHEMRQSQNPRSRKACLPVCLSVCLGRTEDGGTRRSVSPKHRLHYKAHALHCCYWKVLCGCVGRKQKLRPDSFRPTDARDPKEEKRRRQTRPPRNSTGKLCTVGLGAARAGRMGRVHHRARVGFVSRPMGGRFSVPKGKAVMRAFVGT